MGLHFVLLAELASRRELWTPLRPPCLPQIDAQTARQWFGGQNAPTELAFLGGPGWDRTSDLPRVKRTLSH